MDNVEESFKRLVSQQGAIEDIIDLFQDVFNDYAISSNIDPESIDIQTKIELIGYLISTYYYLETEKVEDLEQIADHMEEELEAVNALLMTMVGK